MSKRQKKAAKQEKPKLKLTRADKRQIEAAIRAAKGDGKAHSAQQSIPYRVMYPDGICKVNDRLYSKTMQFEDINYQLAQPDDKTAIFEGLCDFYNSVDSSVGLQLTFLNKTVNREEYESSISIPMQQDGFDDVRAEYSAMLKKQLSKGNNGLSKTKYLTFAL